MQNKIRSILAFVALAMCMFAASAEVVTPGPAAVWDGNFGEEEVNGFSLDKIGVTSADNYVTIGNDSNNNTNYNQGLLVNFPNHKKYGSFTVLVRYANFTGDKTKTNVLFAATSNDTHAYNTYGVWISPDGFVAGFYNSNNSSFPNYNVEENSCATKLDIAESGILAFVYGMSGGISAYASSKGEFLESNSLKVSSLDSEAMSGISVGGHCRSDYADGTQSAVGMTISGLAVFTNVLNVAQMNDYSWPNAFAEHSVKIAYDWFEEDIDGSYSGAKTTGASYSQDLSIEGDVLKVDTQPGEPLFYTPPAYLGDATSYRIEAVVKSICVHSSTNSLPVGEMWGAETPFASIAAAVGDDAQTNWYGWAGSEWKRLGCTPVPVDGNTYTNAIELAVEGGELKAKFYINSEDSPICDAVAGVQMTELPVGPKLGFAGFGEFQRFFGKGMAKLTFTTQLSESALEELGVDLSEGETIAEALAKSWDNGLTAWQNIVLGISKDDATAGKLPFVAPVQNAEPGQLSFSVGNYTPNSNLVGNAPKFTVYEVDENGNEVETEGKLASEETDLGKSATIPTTGIDGVRYFKIRIKFE